MTRSLAFRLALGTTLGFLISSSIAFLFLDQTLKSVLANRIDESLETQILDLSASLGLDEKGAAPQHVQETLERIGLTHGSKDIFFRIFDGKTKVIAHSNDQYWEDIHEHPVPIFDDIHPLFHWSSQTTRLHPFGVRWLGLRLDGGFTLQIGMNLEDTHNLLRKGRWIFASAIALVLVIGILVSVIMTRQGLKGLKAIGRVADGVRKELNFEHTVQLPTGCQETDHLATAFNLMLAQIQKLIQSQKEIMDNIAHDIRSPVARVRVLAESKLDSRKDSEIAGQVVEGCDHILDLVNTLLEISASESGTAPLKMVEFDLSEVVLECCELLAPLAEFKNCTLIGNPGSPAMIRADLQLIQRVISNLIDNAIKFTSEHGNVEVHVEQHASFTELRIADSGIGIKEDSLDHIFDRFVKLDPSRSQGNGLGLSFCRAAVQSMGGQIYCESVQGQGSTFIVRLKNP